MIMHVAGTSVPQPFESRRGAELAGRFGVDACARREARWKRREQSLPRIVGERRIEKHDVEQASFAREIPKRVVDVRLDARQVERTRGRFQHADQRRVAITATDDAAPRDCASSESAPVPA